MAAVTKMLREPTLLTTPALVPRPLVEAGLGVLVDSVKLDGVGDETAVVVVVVEDKEDGIEEPPKVEVGGEVDVTKGRAGMGVGLSKQTSYGPGLTVITGVSLPSPLESPRTITTSVPTGIVIIPQVKETPVTLVKAAATGPSALPVWKDWENVRNSVLKPGSRPTHKAEGR